MCCSIAAQYSVVVWPTTQIVRSSLCELCSSGIDVAALCEFCSRWLSLRSTACQVQVDSWDCEHCSRPTKRFGLGWFQVSCIRALLMAGTLASALPAQRSTSVFGHQYVIQCADFPPSANGLQRFMYCREWCGMKFKSGFGTRVLERQPPTLLAFVRFEATISSIFTGVEFQDHCKLRG